MSAEYQFLGEAQLKSLYATEYRHFGISADMSREVNKKLFGARVSTRRLELGMSQEELAKAASMKQQGIGAIESGIVERPRKLKEIAAALKVEEDCARHHGGRSNHDPRS